jgi:hypothetical protein
MNPGMLGMGMGINPMMNMNPMMGMGMGMVPQQFNNFRGGMMRGGPGGMRGGPGGYRGGAATMGGRGTGRGHFNPAFFDPNAQAGGGMGMGMPQMGGMPGAMNMGGAGIGGMPTSGGGIDGPRVKRARPDEGWASNPRWILSIALYILLLVVDVLLR